MKHLKASPGARLRFISITASAVVLLSLVSAANAGLKEAVAAKQRGDYASAHVELEQLARGGNAEAMYHLAEMKRYGYGIAKDELNAWTLLNQAAKAGNAQAMSAVAAAWLYGDTGVGFAADFGASKQWALKAANAGDIKGMTMLYEFPQLDITDAERLAWMRKADDLGSEKARIAQLESHVLAKRFIDYYLLAIATAKAPSNWRSTKLDTVYPVSYIATTYLASSFEAGTEGFPADKAAAYKWVLVAAAHPAAKTNDALMVPAATVDRLKQRGINSKPTMSHVLEMHAEDLAKTLKPAEKAKAKMLAEDILDEIQRTARAIAEASAKQ